MDVSVGRGLAVSVWIRTRSLFFCMAHSYLFAVFLMRVFDEARDERIESAAIFY